MNILKNVGDKWIKVGKIKVEKDSQINEILKDDIEKFTKDLGEALDTSKKKKEKN